MEDKELFATVMKNASNDVYEVCLKDIEANVNMSEPMITAGHGQPSMVQHQVTKKSSVRLFKNIQINDGDSHQAVIPWIRNICEISVMIIDSEHNLFQIMMKKLQMHFNKLNQNEGTVSSPSVGHPCVALFHEDSMWYRAIIQEVAKAAAKVRV